MVRPRRVFTFAPLLSLARDAAGQPHHGPANTASTKALHFIEAARSSQTPDAPQAPGPSGLRLFIGVKRSRLGRPHRRTTRCGAAG